MKRGYFVCGIDDSAGFAVVAHSVREAKQIMYSSGELEADWIDLRAIWVRKANVEGLQIGVVYDSYDALRRGMYKYLEEGECDECGSDTTLYCHNGRALCCECIDKLVNIFGLVDMMGSVRG